MMQPFLNPSPSDWDSLTERPTASYEALEPLVSSVFDTVSKNGNSAIIDYTAQFDGIQLPDFKVAKDEFVRAESKVPLAVKKSHPKC
jgi:histidinol dehydrogenase